MVSILAEEPLSLIQGLEYSVVSFVLKLLFDFQSQQSEAWISSVLLRLLVASEKTESERETGDVSCASGLPQPLFLGLVLRGG